MSINVLEQLTHLAHDLWVERMRDGGWTAGDTFDSSARVHDAMRPFEDLAERDQRFARDAVEASGVIAQLDRCLDYPRGHAAHWSRLTEGTHVRLIETDQVTDLHVAPGEIGVVEVLIWTGDGQPLEVTVLWPSGDRSVHVQADGDLAIVL